MKNKRSLMTVALMLVLALVLSACAIGANVKAEAGTLLVKVNPEVAINYDDNGNVKTIVAKNKDAKTVIEGFTGFEGRPVREVAKELVERIKDKGFLVEEVEGKLRKVVIEVEKGSKVPNDQFVFEVVEDIKAYVHLTDLNTTVKTETTSDYGQFEGGLTVIDVTDYDQTDYDDKEVKVEKEVITKKEETVVNTTKQDSPYEATNYDSPYDDVEDSPYDDKQDSPYEATNYDSPYDDVEDSPYDNDDSNYDDSNYDDSNYDDSGYDDSGYDD